RTNSRCFHSPASSASFTRPIALLKTRWRRSGSKLRAKKPAARPTLRFCKRRSIGLSDRRFDAAVQRFVAAKVCSQTGFAVHPITRNHPNLFRYFLIPLWLIVKNMKMTKLRSLILAGFLALPVASSYAQVDISVGFAPPPLPVYEQPECPVAGYIWTPG